MLSKRIIPCLDIDNGRVVKGTKFLNIRDAGDPSELANFYNKEGADELVFLDITATHENRKTLIDVVRNVSSQVFIPLTVGGGIRALNDMKIMLEAGADKVSINSSAISNPKLITECAKEFGSQCVVSAIDVKKIDTQWTVFTHGGRKVTDIDVIDWVQIVEENGAGEILLTSMDKDGSYDGYDLELLNRINEKISIPLIASGGAGKLEHLVDALSVGNADAVLAASIFHYGEFSIKQAKDFLRKNKIQVRL
ncbi:MAG: imidazole glycerol phosphate synthase subunit HisF [Dehalococcoidia bacterium]|nr:imidazole glycerol phosphate synthase subunit HisF [Dehalococcoidia bacterium]